MTNEDPWVRFDEVVHHLIDPPLAETRTRLTEIEKAIEKQMEGVAGAVRGLDDAARGTQGQLTKAVESLNETCAKLETTAKGIADALTGLRGSIDKLEKESASRDGAAIARLKLLQRTMWMLCAIVSVCVVCVLVVSALLR